MDYKILSPVDDWIFKLLFGDDRHKNNLISLLKAFVDLPEDEYELIFLDTHLKPEMDEDKLGILDVKVKNILSGNTYNVEIQVNPVKDIGKRLSFYKSKLIVEQISESQHYSVIQKVICLCITDYIIFPGVEECLNHFQFYNKKNNLCFEGIPEEISTLELPKVPAQGDGSSRWDWMQFLKAKSKEEFDMVAARNPEVREAVNNLYELSANDKVRAEYEMRMKAWRDRASAMDGAHEDGRDERAFEIARKMKVAGKPLEEIGEFTGLSEKQINNL